MYYIQSGSGEFTGYYFMGFVGASPIWTDQSSEAFQFGSEEDAAPIEQRLELHGCLCFIVPA